MSWGISTRGLKQVSSFAAAERIWNSAVPWRNELASWRQLDARRMRHKRLVQLSDGRGYECVLHQTPIVTYYADGKVGLRGYNSQSTQLFAWAMRPEGCRSVSHDSRMWWAVDTDSGTHYAQCGDAPLILEPTSKGKWRLLSPTREVTERAYDAKAGAQARKLIKPYVAWFNLTSKLNGGAYYGRFAAPSRSDVQQLLDNPVAVETFPVLAVRGATPELVRKHAYEITGAYFQAPVPHDRLPRISK